MFAPRPVSNEIKTFNITGHVFPWIDDGPCFIEMHGSDDWYLPVFSTADLLRAYMSAARIAYERIKQIQDQHEFLDSIPYRHMGIRIRIAVDCWVTPQQTTRFGEIIREDG